MRNGSWQAPWLRIQRLLRRPMPSAMPEADQAGEHTHNPLVRYFKLLGPGLVTGASDDDPGGIATYSVAGASLGYGMLWTAIATFPLMAAVQLICARIGLVTGRGPGVLRDVTGMRRSAVERRV